MTEVEETPNDEQLPTVEQAQQLTEHWLNKLRTERDQLTKQKTGWSRMLERARRWLSREQSAEEQLLHLEMDLQQLADQLEHASADDTLHLLRRLVETQQKCETALDVSESLDINVDSGGLEEERYGVQLVGVAKPRLNQEFKSGQLGRFGQDVLRADRKRGTLTVADGVSSAPDSYEVARRVSFRADQLLQAIPDHLQSVKAIQQWVAERLPELATVLQTMDGFGATTVLATRYLDWCDALVSIDIGDCQQALVAGDQVYALQPEQKHTNTPDTILKSKQKSQISSRNNKIFTEYVRVTPLQEFRTKHPGVELRLLQSSDGIENNTGEHLVTAAQRMLGRDLESILLEFNKGKDDIAIGEMTLPVPHQAVVALAA